MIQSDLDLIYNFKEDQNSFQDRSEGYKKKFYWSDFDEKLRVSHKDILIDYNLSALYNAIDNILRIAPYEIPGRPEFGVALERFLGEKLDDILKEEIEDLIKWAINKYEPRVKIISINFDENEENIINNILIFEINFKIVSDNSNQTHSTQVRITQK